MPNNEFSTLFDAILALEDTGASRVKSLSPIEAALGLEQPNQGMFANTSGVTPSPFPSALSETVLQSILDTPLAPPNSFVELNNNHGSENLTQIIESLGGVRTPPSPFSLASIIDNQTSTGFVPDLSERKWIYVERRFKCALDNLTITDNQFEEGIRKARHVTLLLNRAFWGYDSETDHCILIGSWGKQTRVSPPRDVDMLFILPYYMYERFQRRVGNKQSQLLQAVRAALNPSYATHIRGDNQVVVLPFHSTSVEVAPVFERQGGGYLGCDTTSDGRYTWIDPIAEISELDSYDKFFNNNVRKISRLLKQWQRHCKVPIKSFHLEHVVKMTLGKLSYGGNGEFWFDWIVREVFHELLLMRNSYFFMPTTNECVSLGEAWASKAESAYNRAVKACDYEYQNMQVEAGQEWQRIFGTMIPVRVK